MQAERAAELIAVWTAEALVEQARQLGELQARAIEAATAPLIARLAELEDTLDAALVVRAADREAVEVAVAAAAAATARADAVDGLVKELTALQEGSGLAMGEAVATLSERINGLASEQCNAETAAEERFGIFAVATDTRITEVVAMFTEGLDEREAAIVERLTLEYAPLRERLTELENAHAAAADFAGKERLAQEEQQAELDERLIAVTDRVNGITKAVDIQMAEAVAVVANALDDVRATEGAARELLKEQFDGIAGAQVADAEARSADAIDAAVAAVRETIASEIGAVDAMILQAVKSNAASEADLFARLDMVGKRVDGVDERLVAVAERAGHITDDLVARIDAVEARPPVKGDPGEPGLDMPVIDLIAEWNDDTETLARGVLLTEAGSLFLSLREAHGPPSVEPSTWLPLATGLHIERADYADDRQLVITARSGHDEITLPLALPVPVWRGTWDAERDFAEHDLATWDGAVWRASDSVTPGYAPDQPNSGWTIYQPRGKTGRPGKEGNPGRAGAPGRGIANVLTDLVDNHLAFELTDGEVVKVDLTPLIQTLADALNGGAGR